MKIVLTTVKKATVMVDETIISQIKGGFLILLGMEANDSEADIKKLASKIMKLRVFADEEDKINLSLADISGEILLVSQFTLSASVKKSNRPSFTAALGYDEAFKFYELFISELRNLGAKVSTGKYGAHMEVESINDGPFTLIIQSKDGKII